MVQPLKNWQIKQKNQNQYNLSCTLRPISIIIVIVILISYIYEDDAAIQISLTAQLLCNFTWPHDTELLALK